MMRVITRPLKPRYRYYAAQHCWICVFSPWRATGRHYPYRLNCKDAMI